MRAEQDDDCDKLNNLMHLYGLLKAGLKMYRCSVVLGTITIAPRTQQHTVWDSIYMSFKLVGVQRKRLEVCMHANPDPSIC